MRQIFGLIHEAAPQAPGIDLLQPDQIVFPQENGDPVKVEQPFPVRKQMLPALCQVMAIVLSVDTGLNVIAQHPYTLL